jgi:acetylornithine/succinyldiaminopimelate/putrescine aminotransferase
MLGLVLSRPAKDVVAAMQEKGLIAVATADTVVRFLPPLIVTDEEVAKALDITEQTLKEKF